MSYCQTDIVMLYYTLMTKFLFATGHKHSVLTLKKLSDTKLGDKNPRWRGGRVSDGNGYIKVRVAPCQYKLEHRLIVEQHLGRELKRDEHVHHINGKKSDNRIENLIVIQKAFHHKIHLTKYIGCLVDGCTRKHRTGGYCAYHYNRRLNERRQPSATTERN